MTEYRPAAGIVLRAVRGTTDKLAGGRLQALSAMTDPDAARARARDARQRAVSALPASLARFEAAAAANGTTVHRAPDAAAAVRIVEDLLDGAGARRVVKSKSMATEEIRLRDRLEEGGREVLETDLGEWIVQLAGQVPSHIIIPAVHLPRQRIRALLSAVAGRDLGPQTPALAGFARGYLREKFLQAQAGISGANVLIADTGGLMIVSNEGNARMCTTLPRLHIAVVGVEKVVGSLEDALDVLAVLPRSATGQAITQYVSFLHGPRRPDDPEGDGPDALHVVLLDNGRSRLVGTPAEELLYCIRCGACLNVCPVYRTMGGHGYQSIYPGPIGAALTPRLTQGREGRDLPWASSLCGACREACPVGIQLDDQLIALRAEYPKPVAERAAMRAFAEAAGRPAVFGAGLRVVRVLLGGQATDRLPGVLDAWTRTRRLRAVAPPALRRHIPAREAGLFAAVVPAEAILDAPPRAGLQAAAVPDPGVAGRGDVQNQAVQARAPSAAGEPGRAAGEGAAASAGAGGGTAGPESGQAGQEPAEQAADVLAAFLARWEAQGGRASVVERPGLEAAVREAVGAGPVSPDPVLAGLVEGIAEADSFGAAVGLVWADAAAAETGSVVLRSGAAAERRRSLLPPRAVFVVDADMLYADLRAAFAALGLTAGGTPESAAVTLISGPSRSADIENDLVIGVHGPGEAVAIIVRQAGGEAGGAGG